MQSYCFFGLIFFQHFADIWYYDILIKQTKIISYLSIRVAVNQYEYSEMLISKLIIKKYIYIVYQQCHSLNIFYNKFNWMIFDEIKNIDFGIWYKL